MVSPQRPYIPDHIRHQVETEARHRCGYCLTDRRFTAKRLHTTVALRLNHPFLVEARRWWVQAGWHPPEM